VTNAVSQPRVTLRYETTDPPGIFMSGDSCRCHRRSRVNSTHPTVTSLHVKDIRILSSTFTRTLPARQ